MKLDRMRLGDAIQAMALELGVSLQKLMDMTGLEVKARRALQQGRPQSREWVA